jgi:hypothetical protein
MFIYIYMLLFLIEQFFVIISATDTVNIINPFTTIFQMKYKHLLSFSDFNVHM